MESKIMQVFYDRQCLPFKDKERSIHYPITGGAFAGAHDTTKIRFYVDQIGGVNNVSWVSVVKLPNTKEGLFQVLSTIALDTTINEYYVELSLSSRYTQQKGDIYIALNGYSGEIQIETDEETHISTIVGTPMIQATGSIKIAINYAPVRPTGIEFSLDQYADIITALSTKSNIINSIQVVSDIDSVITSGYSEGQLFYALEQHSYFKLANGEIGLADYGLLGSDKTIYKYNFDEEMTMNELQSIIGLGKMFVLNHLDQDKLFELVEGPSEYYLCCYYFSGYGKPRVARTTYNTANTLEATLTDLDQYALLEESTETSKIYATNQSGFQTMLGYANLPIPNTIPIRDGNGQIGVAFSPRAVNDATSKHYVDSEIEDKATHEISISNIRDGDSYALSYQTKNANGETIESGSVSLQLATQNDAGILSKEDKTKIDTLGNVYETQAHASSTYETKTNHDNDINDLQSQIDAIISKSDVVDVVGTYQELQSYDTSKLGDKDIIKVLVDSTHNNERSYYRFNKSTNTFSYVGSEGSFYTKSESDEIFLTKSSASSTYQNKVYYGSSAPQSPSDNDIWVYDGNNLKIYKNGAWKEIAKTIDSEFSTTSENALQNKVITNKFNEKADKGGDYRNEGLISRLSSNLITERGQTIDANIESSSGQSYKDQANNAKGTGTYFPYGSSDRLSIKSSNETIQNVYGHSYVKNQLVDSDTTELVLTTHKYLCNLSGTSTIKSNTTISVVGGTDKVVDLTLLDQELANTPNLTPEMVMKKYPDILSWEYNAGEIIDAEDFTYSSSGINLWDEQWELGSISSSGKNETSQDRIRSKNYIECLPNTELYFKAPNNLYVAFYDKDKNFIERDFVTKNATYTSPLNAHYFRFFVVSTTTYANNIQICLHYTDSELENTYHQFVAPSTKEIKYYGGVGRSAGSVKDEVDYVNKKRIKRVGSIDLSTIAFNAHEATQGGKIYFHASISSIPGIKYATGSRLLNGTAEKYTITPGSNIFETNVNNYVLGTSSSEIRIITDGTNTLTPSGILNYELETPIEEDIPQDELNNILPCNDYGIESKSNGVIAGMKVLYQINPLDTIFNNREDIEMLDERVSALETTSIETTHDIRVNTTTAQGTYNYQFELPTTDTTPYTQLGQAGHYLFANKPNVRIPASGVYVEGTTLYIVTSIRSSTNDNMVIVEMYKVSDGTLKEIETGVVSVSDTIL